jgi:hypothetical protein
VFEPPVTPSATTMASGSAEDRFMTTTPAELENWLAGSDISNTLVRVDLKAPSSKEHLLPLS